MQLTFKRFLCTWVLILCSAFSIFAQNLEFIENKGQWDDRVKFKSDLGGSVFFLQQQGYKVLLNNKEDLEAIADYFSGHNHNKKVSEVPRNLSSPGPEKKTILRSHAYEVKFLGASATAKIIPDKPIDTYNNYFYGNDPSKWKTDCKLYRAVVYENLYPGIDARYYTAGGNLKYDLIVHPNADISKIALQFTGVNGLSVKNGNLIVKTSVGDITEMRPYCYQVSDKGRSDVDAKYVVEGNTVKFKINSYSMSSTLVIDPTLIFASFTGSLTDNWGYTATYDGAGNLYAGGIAFGSGYPTSTGSFQTDFGGGTNEGLMSGYDAAIIKLSSNGVNRIFATYLGGSSNEQPHSMIVDNTGSLIVAGRTNSSNFPVVSPNFGPGGLFDIFITKFTADGRTIIGSRRIGGRQDDGVNVRSKEIAGPISTTRNYGDDARSEVIVDNANNIYLVSCTQSGDFPVTSGVLQSTNAGNQDGVVIKASPDLGNILFSTFLGGGGDDATFVLALHPSSNNIYIAGATTSTNLRGTSGNNGPIIFSTSRGGATDGFVTIINNSGTAIVKTVYVGTNGVDMVYGIQIDKFGFPYITGTTTVTFQVVNSPFNQVEQANGKQFITKMQPDLSGVIYNANFGKGQSVPDISPTAFLVDRCENVYVAGWGGGINAGEGYANANTSGLKTTPDAIRLTSDGSDFYFFVMEKNALSQLYGTFYGNIDNVPDVGDHVDGGTSRFDREGVIYQALCANCGKLGIPMPTAPGNVWGPNNLASTNALCNQAVLKIAFEFAGVGSGIQSSINGVPRDTSGCLPLTVDFSDTIANGKKFIWSFSDGSPDVTTTIPSVTHTFNAVGRFKVRLVSIDSLTCNIADTSYTTIIVRDDEADISFTSLKLPPCDSLKYQFTNTSVAPPGKPFGPLSFQWDFGDGQTIVTNAPTVTHSYPAPGTYNVKLRLVDTNYCNAPDSAVLSLRIAANVVAQFETPPFGCVPYTAAFSNTSLAGQEFFWDFGDGTTSTLESPTHLYNTIGTYTVKLVVRDAQTCNLVDSTEQTILVSPKPTALYDFGPKPPLENTPTQFSNLSTGGTRYKWLFGDGDSLITVRRDTIVSHIYNASGIFNACLIAYNDYDCTDTLCQPVESIIVPLVDVPNAFTPNGDGKNDRVTVRGYGIQTMDWRIFNRWGKMVFQSKNPGDGWDGFFNGALQPQEVYVYVLNITFSDGTKFQKKGDITLVR